MARPPASERSLARDRPASAASAPPERRQPRRSPDGRHTDKAYDAKARRQECRARGMVSRITRNDIESSERLGRDRWVIERTYARFNRFRPLPIRNERRADIDKAFTSRIPQPD
ncbi:transposase [Methylorubrum populi]|uniref:Transposase n=1 Tax=Methylorubrum populi TaxID=223967 RepID=A0A169RAS6_9HYPH|nr:transposase [Methylorubrum populi]